MIYFDTEVQKFFYKTILKQKHISPWSTYSVFIRGKRQRKHDHSRVYRYTVEWNEGFNRNIATGQSSILCTCASDSHAEKQQQNLEFPTCQYCLSPKGEKKSSCHGVAVPRKEVQGRTEGNSFFTAPWNRCSDKCASHCSLYQAKFSCYQRIISLNSRPFASLQKKNFKRPYLVFFTDLISCQKGWNILSLKLTQDFFSITPPEFYI